MSFEQRKKYSVFYQEIPSKDYLKELDTDINDLVDEQPEVTGLTVDQVSQLKDDIQSHTSRPDVPARRHELFGDPADVDA